jgi:spore coat polysaccharide biosynthesis protein SpsF
MINNKNIGIIIQARTDSTRFPKKVLAKIQGKPLLWHVIKRVKKIHEGKIIVATTKRKIDSEIVEIAKKNDVDFFRGKKNDVLDRYLSAANKFDIDIIIRITADCPLIDPKVIKKVLRKFLKGNFDYVATDDISFPKGLDAECFSVKSLKKSSNLIKNESDREHVTKFIYENPTKFKIGYVYNKKKIPITKYWVVDYKRDLDFIKAIYSYLYKKNEIFNMEDIIKILEKKRKIFSKLLFIR